MSLDSRQIYFLDVSGCELRLELTCVVARSGKDDHTGRVGVEPMDGPQLLRIVHGVQNRLQRVAIEPTRRVQWQRCWFVEHDERVVFVQHSNGRVDVEL